MTVFGGKVTADLMESNGSLQSGDDLKSHQQADRRTLGSAPGPTLGNEYGRTSLLVQKDVCFLCICSCLYKEPTCHCSYTDN